MMKRPTLLLEHLSTIRLRRMLKIPFGMAKMTRKLKGSLWAEIQWRKEQRTK